MPKILSQVVKVAKGRFSVKGRERDSVNLVVRKNVERMGKKRAKDSDNKKVSKIIF